MAAYIATLAGAAEFWVAPDGNDAAKGTKTAPFQTLGRAREALRGLPGQAREAGVTVWLRGGSYELPGTFELDTRDSGNKGAPTVFQAAPGERPCLSGGRKLAAERFVPVTDPEVLERLDPAARGKLLACNLREFGIMDFGTLSREAFNGGPMLELFVNGQSLPLSRWPNGKEWASYGKVIDAGSIPRWNEKPDRPGTFEYKGDRPKRWLKAPEVWLHGYWAFDWYDDVLKVAKLDPETRRITFTTPHTYGLKSGRRFAALNLLEEIDVPGEWMLDRESGMLYLYPPADIKGAEIAVSMVGQPLVRLSKTQSVELRGLTFEYGRDRAVDIRGGTDNLVAGCTIRNMGTSAVSIAPVETRKRGNLTVETGDELVDGRRNGVVGCDIYDVGTSGVSLTGGDRGSLAPAGHYAENNDIHHYSRRKRTNCPAVGLGGVGNRARNNYVHDAPHCGMTYGGNDHLIERNEFARLCWETGDVGAIYTGRDWTFRGNVVRNNFIHHTIAPGQVGSMGVYLDDSHSSTAIVGNVFYKCDYAAFIGGGHDNAVENNVFVDCNKSVHLDNRSQGWAHKYQIKGGDHRMFGKLDDVRYNQPPYSTRYPKLAKILDGDPHAPTGNSAVRNVCVRGRWLHLFPGGEKVMEIHDNLVVQEDPGFVDAARMNFALKPDSRVFREIPGFQAIPFAEIGLKLDENRTSLPPRAPRIVPDGGAFSDPLQVRIEAAPGACEIHYTLDGSEPTGRSPVYTGPFALARSATVRAATVPLGDPGARPSPVAEASFTRVEFGEGKGVYLSDLPTVQAFAHGGLIKDRNYRRNDFITFAGTVYQKGIMICPETRKKEGDAVSYAVYALTPPLDKATRFRAVVGIDDGADHRGSVSFRVEVQRQGKWETAYQSPVLYGRPKAEHHKVDVDVRGATALRVSTDGGNDISADHAAWAEARLE
jgi:parallel beta-helix repeat protein